MASAFGFVQDQMPRSGSDADQDGWVVPFRLAALSGASSRPGANGHLRQAVMDSRQAWLAATWPGELSMSLAWGGGGVPCCIVRTTFL